MAANRTTNIIIIAALVLVGVAVVFLVVGSPEPDGPQVAEVRPPTPQPPPPVDGPTPVDADDYVLTESGLKIHELEVGEGPMPGASAGVTIAYEGWMDGELFDSSERRGGPVDFILGGHEGIAAWHEAVASMRVGGRRQLVVPPELGFGQAGSPRLGVPSGATLVYEVELVDTAGPRIPPEAAEVLTEDRYVTTESGLRYAELAPGDGAVASPGSVVVVEYTGWLEDGKRFDSSLSRPGPQEFQLGEVIPGWNEGIAGMKVGGRRQLVVPPELAYGDKGRMPIIPPDATLRFEVELVEVK